MISHQKVSQLRIERSAHPQAPFWQATTVAPYGPLRGQPLALNYLTLSASGKPKSEITVTRAVADQLERERRIDEPVLVESADVAEIVFRRGEEALRFLQTRNVPAAQLISTTGCVPHVEAKPGTTIVISCWPLLSGDLESLFGHANERGLSWGAIVPVIYPVTSKPDALARLADLAAEHRARFFTAVPIDLDPPARQLLAEGLSEDDEAWRRLLDSDLERETVETERRVAALATERGMADYVLPHDAEATTNWNAAILLALAGTRMIRMKRDTELGWTLLRSSKLIAQLHKPIERIASSASLSIIESLDIASVEALEEWIHNGTSTFFDEIDSEWRDVEPRG